MKPYLLIGCFVFYIIGAKAQKNQFIKDFDSKVFKAATQEGWVVFNENIDVKPNNLFEKFPKAFGLNGKFKMKNINTSKGMNGYQHDTYKQYYNNIEIASSAYILHSKNEKLISANGDIFNAKTVVDKINITEAEALEICLKKLNAKKYNWQDDYKKNKLKLKKNDANVTYYPKATKMYIYEEASAKLILCYQFFIMAIDPGLSSNCYVDVSNGNILKMLPLVQNCNPSNFTSNYNGIQTIFTSPDPNPLLQENLLKDDCTPYNIQVIDATNGFTFSDKNNIWDTPNQVSAATSLWALKRTYETFKTFFNRDGHSGSNSDIEIYHGYVFQSNSFDNAAYQYDPGGDDQILIGLGGSSNNNDDYNTLDILAHEFTHGIDEYEGELVYSGESGALDESFADIFAEWVESKTSSVDWLLGAQRVTGAIRSLINPNDYSDPNTYGGNFWHASNNSADNFGVHTNSGVQNQMFYLLSLGGSGWNNGLTCHAPINTGYQWSVNGIGMDNAITIAYKVLTEYMTNNSNYGVSRNAWVQAASEIYGECSNQAIQTGRAWDAVGIHPPPSAGIYNLCGNLSGNNINFGGTINVNSCNTTIDANAQPVYLSASNKIVIGNQFRAFTGSQFTATINDCQFAVY